MPESQPTRSPAGSGAGSVTAWGFLAPALLLLALSVLIPGAMALVISFSRTGLDVGEPLQFIGLANFRRLLADPMLLKVSGTTFLYL
ncbi:MAG: sugar ABC transporter permease, partial [Cyanobacteria bacterium]|nr:sugar ABC transporter permease [Cyanobacteriota bacterium]